MAAWTAPGGKIQRPTPNELQDALDRAAAVFVLPASPITAQRAAQPASYTALLHASGDAADPMLNDSVRQGIDALLTARGAAALDRSGEEVPEARSLMMLPQQSLSDSERTLDLARRGEDDLDFPQWFDRQPARRFHKVVGRSTSLVLQQHRVTRTAASPIPATARAPKRRYEPATPHTSTSVSHQQPAEITRRAAATSQLLPRDAVAQAADASRLHYRQAQLQVLSSARAQLNALEAERFMLQMLLRRALSSWHHRTFGDHLQASTWALHRLLRRHWNFWKVKARVSISAATHARQVLLRRALSAWRRLLQLLHRARLLLALRRWRQSLSRLQIQGQKVQEKYSQQQLLLWWQKWQRHRGLQRVFLQVQLGAARRILGQAFQRWRGQLRRHRVQHATAIEYAALFAAKQKLMQCWRCWRQAWSFQRQQAAIAHSCYQNRLHLQSLHIWRRRSQLNAAARLTLLSNLRRRWQCWQRRLTLSQQKSQVLAAQAGERLIAHRRLVLRRHLYIWRGRSTLRAARRQRFRAMAKLLLEAHRRQSVMLRLVSGTYVLALAQRLRQQRSTAQVLLQMAWAVWQWMLARRSALHASDRVEVDRDGYSLTSKVVARAPLRLSHWQRWLAFILDQDDVLDRTMTGRRHLALRRQWDHWQNRLALVFGDTRVATELRHRHLLSAAWSYWRNALLKCCSHPPLHSVWLKRQCMQKWRRTCTEQGVRRRQSEQLADEWRHRQWLSRWRANASAVRVQGRCIGRQLRNLLCLWRKLTTERRQEQAFSRRKLLVAAWKQWRRRLQTQQTLKAVRQSAALSAEALGLRHAVVLRSAAQGRAFRRWRAAWATQRQHAAQVSRATTFANRQLMGPLWQRWTVLLQRQRQLQQPAVAFDRRRMLGPALQHWRRQRKLISDSAAASLFLVTIPDRRRRRLAAAWRRWTNVMSRFRQRAESIQHTHGLLAVKRRYWAKWVRCFQRVRQLVEAAHQFDLEHCPTRDAALLRRSLRHWQQLSGSSSRFQAGESAMMRAVTLQILRRTWQTWRRKLAAQQRQQAAAVLSLAVQQHVHQQLRAMFTMWRDAFRRSTSHKLLAYQCRRKVLVFTALRQWRGQISRLKVWIQHQVEQGRTSLDHSRVERTLRRWRVTWQCLRAARELQRRSLLKNAWQLWKESMNQQAAQMAEAAKHWHEVRLTRALTFWRRGLLQQRRHRSSAQLDLIAGRWHINRKLRELVRRWQMQLRALQENSVKALAHFDRQRQAATLSSRFQHWRTVLRSTRTLLAQHNEMADHHQRRQLQTMYLRQWRRRGQQTQSWIPLAANYRHWTLQWQYLATWRLQHRLSQGLRTVSQRRQCLQIQTSLRIWRQAYQCRQRQKERLALAWRDAEELSATHLRRTFWRRWRLKWQQQTKSALSKSSLAESFAQTRKRRIFFQQWQVRHRHQSQQLLTADTFRRRQLLKRAWDRWHGVIMAAQAAENQLLQWAGLWPQRQLLWHCIASWATVWRTTRERDRQAAASADRHLALNCWRQWRKSLTRHQAVANAAVASAQTFHARRLQQHYLALWRHRQDKRHLAALQSADGTVAQYAVQRAWHRWRRLVEARTQLRSESLQSRLGLLEQRRRRALFVWWRQRLQRITRQCAEADRRYLLSTAGSAFQLWRYHHRLMLLAAEAHRLQRLHAVLYQWKRRRWQHSQAAVLRTAVDDTSHPVSAQISTLAVIAEADEAEPWPVLQHTDGRGVSDARDAVSNDEQVQYQYPSASSLGAEQSVGDEVSPQATSTSLMGADTEGQRATEDNAEGLALTESDVESLRERDTDAAELMPTEADVELVPATEAHAEPLTETAANAGGSTAAGASESSVGVQGVEAGNAEIRQSRDEEETPGVSMRPNNSAALEQVGLQWRLRRMWAHWRLAKSVAEALRHAQEWADHRNLAVTVLLWRRAALLRRRYQDLHNQQLLMIQRRSFTHWRRSLGQQRASLRVHRHMVLAKALKTWHRGAHEPQLLWRSLRTAELHRRQWSLRQSWKTWHGGLQAARGYQQIRAMRLQQRVFQRWRGAFLTVVHDRQALTLAVELLCHGRLARIMQRWRTATHHYQVLASRAAEQNLQAQRFLQRYLLLQWREASRARRTLQLASSSQPAAATAEHGVTEGDTPAELVMGNEPGQQVVAAAATAVARLSAKARHRRVMRGQAHHFIQLARLQRSWRAWCRRSQAVSELDHRAGQTHGTRLLQRAFQHWQTRFRASCAMVDGVLDAGSSELASTARGEDVPAVEPLSSHLSMEMDPLEQVEVLERNAEALAADVLRLNKLQVSWRQWRAAHAAVTFLQRRADTHRILHTLDRAYQTWFDGFAWHTNAMQQLKWWHVTRLRHYWRQWTETRKALAAARLRSRHLVHGFLAQWRGLAQRRTALAVCEQNGRARALSHALAQWRNRLLRLRTGRTAEQSLQLDVLCQSLTLWRQRRTLLRWRQRAMVARRRQRALVLLRQGWSMRKWRSVLRHSWRRWQRQLHIIASQSSIAAAHARTQHLATTLRLWRRHWQALNAAAVASWTEGEHQRLLLILRRWQRALGHFREAQASAVAADFQRCLRQSFRQWYRRLRHVRHLAATSAEEAGFQPPLAVERYDQEPSSSNKALRMLLMSNVSTVLRPWSASLPSNLEEPWASASEQAALLVAEQFRRQRLSKVWRLWRLRLRQLQQAQLWSDTALARQTVLRWEKRLRQRRAEARVIQLGRQTVAKVVLRQKWLRWRKSWLHHHATMRLVGMRHQQRLQLRHCWQRWRRALQAQQSYEHLQALQRRRRLQLAWRRWRTRFTLQQGQEQRFVVAVRVTLLLYKSWQHWRQALALRRGRQHSSLLLYAVYNRQRRERFVRRFWALWRQKTAQRAVSRRKPLVALAQDSRRTARLLQMSWQRWRSRWAAVNAAPVLFYHRLLRRRSWRHWCRVWRDRQQRRTVLLSLAVPWLQSTRLATAWHRWRRRMVDMQEAYTTLVDTESERVVARPRQKVHLDVPSSSALLSSLRQTSSSPGVDGAGHESAADSLIDQWHRQRRLKRALRLWRRRYFKITGSSTRQSATDRVWTQVQLSNAFQAWRHVFLIQNSLRRRLKVFLAVNNDSARRRALARWRWAAEMSGRARQGQAQGAASHMVVELEKHRPILQTAWRPAEPALESAAPTLPTGIQDDALVALPDASGVDTAEERGDGAPDLLAEPPPDSQPEQLAPGDRLGHASLRVPRLQAVQPSIPVDAPDQSEERAKSNLTVDTNSEPLVAAPPVWLSSQLGKQPQTESAETSAVDAGNQAQSSLLLHVSWKRWHLATLRRQRQRRLVESALETWTEKQRSLQLTAAWRRWKTAAQQRQLLPESTLRTGSTVASWFQRWRVQYAAQRARIDDLTAAAAGRQLRRYFDIWRERTRSVHALERMAQQHLHGRRGPWLARWALQKWRQSLAHRTESVLLREESATTLSLTKYVLPPLQLPKVSLERESSTSKRYVLLKCLDTWRRHWRRNRKMLSFADEKRKFLLRSLALSQWRDRLRKILLVSKAPRGFVPTVVEGPLEKDPEEQREDGNKQQSRPQDQPWAEVAVHSTDARVRDSREPVVEQSSGPVTLVPVEPRAVLSADVPRPADVSVSTVGASTVDVLSDRRSQLQDAYQRIRQQRHQRIMIAALDRWRVNTRVQQFLRLEDERRHWLHRVAPSLEESLHVQSAHGIMELDEVVFYAKSLPNSPLAAALPSQQRQPSAKPSSRTLFPASPKS